MAGAVDETLTLPQVDCGRVPVRTQRAAARELERRFAGTQRVRVEGFTEQMAEWMAAADALVHSTGGLTVLEALMRGCPAISYGWGRGHVRVNNAAFRRFGLAEVAETRSELHRALERALANGRRATDSLRERALGRFVRARSRRGALTPMHAEPRARDWAAAAALAAWLLPAAAPISPPVAAAFRIPRRLPTATGIAITFDDGPHPEGTPAVLAELERAHARATFFLVGEQVERRPALAREIAAAGHEIAIHGYRHVLLLRRSPRAVRDDFARARDVIGSATGAEPSVYRPPYGVFSAAALLHVRRLGWRPLLWSRWGRDWEARATPQSIARRAAGTLRGGDVVLLHDADHYSSPDAWRKTAAALPMVLESAAARGESLVTVSQST